MENPDQVCRLLGPLIIRVFRHRQIHELLADDSVAMTLFGDSVTLRMTVVGKPVVSMMQEDHDSADFLGSGHVVQPVVVLSRDRSFTRDSGDILSVNDTSDVVQCSAVNGSLSPCRACGILGKWLDCPAGLCSLWTLLVYKR